MILAAAAEAEQKGWAKAQELADWYKGELVKHGMTVEEASDTLKEELKAIGEQMTSDWLEDAGEEGQAIIDTYQAM